MSEHEHDSTLPEHISSRPVTRRSVVKTSAWGAPAVVFAAKAPAAAASTTSGSLSITNVSNEWPDSPGSVRGNFAVGWYKGDPAVQSTATVTAIVTIEGGGLGGLTPSGPFVLQLYGTTSTIYFTFRGLTPGQTYKVTATASAPGLENAVPLEVWLQARSA